MVGDRRQKQLQIEMPNAERWRDASCSCYGQLYQGARQDGRRGDLNLIDVMSVSIIS